MTGTSGQRPELTPSGKPVHDRTAPAEVYRFVAPSRSYRTLQIVSVLTLVGAVVLGIAGLVLEDTSLLIGTGVGAAVTLVLWTVMSSKVPQRVTLTNSIVEIKKSGRTETFDLVDPNVEVLGRDGEMAFRYYDGRVVVIRAQDVDWEVFTDVVMHYQNFADDRAIERTRRFNR